MPIAKRPQETDKPFSEAMLELMDEAGLTYREVAERIRKVDHEQQRGKRGIHHATLNMLVNGHDRPSSRAMILSARAFGLEPTYFAEYRMIQAMDALDPSKVGFQTALRNLNAALRDDRRSH